MTVGGARDTWELDNRESVQYKELVTELTTKVRHCLLGGGAGAGGWGRDGGGEQGTPGSWTTGSLCSTRSWSLSSPPRSGTVYWGEGWELEGGGMTVGGVRDTWELDNRESVQYKELVTELTTEVRHCLLGGGVELEGGGMRVGGARDTWELDNRESVQYKELVTELTTKVRHCLLGEGWELEGGGMMVGESEGHLGAGQQGVCAVQGAGH